MPRLITPQERFWKKIHKTDGCWFWTGCCNAGGYGIFGVTFNGRQTQMGAHRYSYELLIGPIPEGLVLHHLCHNRPCVNPAHLEPITISENARLRTPTVPSSPSPHLPLLQHQDREPTPEERRRQLHLAYELIFSIAERVEKKKADAEGG